MSSFSEFHGPVDGFALAQALRERPEAVVEIECVVATETRLTPYFWVTGVPPTEFATTAATDPSVSDLSPIDEFEDEALFRAQWTDRVEALAYAYTEVGATILEASGEHEEWGLRMRFDDHDGLDRFRGSARSLHELANPPNGSKYGLTPKQSDALKRAWEMGYFDEPRRVTLAEVAAEFDISKQALSLRLRRAHDRLIANTLEIAPPEE